MRWLLFFCLFFSILNASAAPETRGKNSDYVMALKERSLICSPAGHADTWGYLSRSSKGELTLEIYSSQMKVRKIQKNAGGESYSFQVESDQELEQITCVPSRYVFENGICYEVAGSDKKESEEKNCFLPNSTDEEYEAYIAYKRRYLWYYYLNTPSCYGYHYNGGPLGGSWVYCSGGNCSGRTLRNYAGQLQVCR